MQLTLSTNFEVDVDNVALVQFKRPSGFEGLDDVCAVVEINYFADDEGGYSVRFIDMGLAPDATTQARLMLAACEYIVSFFTEAEVPTTVTV